MSFPTVIFILIEIVQLGSELRACEHAKIDVNYRPTRPADCPCAGIPLERRRQALALRVICRMKLRGSVTTDPIFMKIQGFIWINFAPAVNRQPGNRWGDS